MSSVYLDTYIAVYLHEGLVEELSAEARRRIDGNDLLVSPVVLLELENRFVRKKISTDARSLLATRPSEWRSALSKTHSTG